MGRFPTGLTPCFCMGVQMLAWRGGNGVAGAFFGDFLAFKRRRPPDERRTSPSSRVHDGLSM
jgi:hypothetical protein